MIIISYGIYAEDEASCHQPVVVVCDESNRGRHLIEAERSTVAMLGA